MGEPADHHDLMVGRGKPCCRYCELKEVLKLCRFGINIRLMAGSEIEKYFLASIQRYM